MADKFQVWSKSADKEPGKGTGEYVKSIWRYKELGKIKNWRRMLSNTYSSTFQLDDYIWNSVEDFYQASKFRDLDNEESYNLYKTFTINGINSSSTNISKVVKIPKNVSIRQDFITEGIGKKAIVIALFAKFTQNDELKNVLLNTKDAEIWHFNGRGEDPEYLYHLMVVRECIKKYNGAEELRKMSKFSKDTVSKLLSSKYGLILDKKEYTKLYACDKVSLDGKKGIVLARNHHPDGRITYDVKIKNKIKNYVPADKVYKIV